MRNLQHVQRPGNHRRPGEGREPWPLQGLCGGCRGLGGRSGRPGTLLPGAPDRFRRGLCGGSAPLARSQEHDGQPARAPHRHAGGHRRARDADRGQPGPPDSARQPHDGDRGRLAVEPQESARTDPADRPLLLLARQGIRQSRHRHHPLRDRLRWHPRLRGDQRRRRLPARPGSRDREVRRHAAQRHRDRPGGRHPRAGRARAASASIISTSGLSRRSGRRP